MTPYTGRTGGHGREGGEQPDPPAGAFLGAGVQLAHFGGSAQLNLPLTGWRSHYSEAGSIYIRYPYSEAVSAYKFREARACIYILGWGKAAFKELWRGGERLLSQACCLFKQTFAATTPRVPFQWTPWLWSPVNTRLIVKAIAPR